MDKDSGIYLVRPLGKYGYIYSLNKRNYLMYRMILLSMYIMPGLLLLIEFGPFGIADFLRKGFPKNSEFIIFLISYLIGFRFLMKLVATGVIYRDQRAPDYLERRFQHVDGFILAISRIAGTVALSIFFGLAVIVAVLTIVADRNVNSIFGVILLFLPLAIYLIASYLRKRNKLN